MNFDFFVASLETALGSTYTDEQIDFFNDFTKSIISFSDPGTGKTHATVAGLLAAEMVHKIPAQSIFACSFTKEATTELAVRHQTVCKRLGIKSLVNFQTLDSLCLSIVKSHAHILSTDAHKIKELSVVDSMTMEESLLTIEDIAEDFDIVLDQSKMRAIVEAIKSLNSALVFDRAHVESKLAFKKTGMGYDEFTLIRRSMYNMNKILDQVTVSEITLYALEILTKSPEIALIYQDMYKVMVVDEFQDMSLVKLHLLSLLTKQLVVVGDIKQQIYGFNGACLEIVQKYREYYPEHREVKLTQSFRCASEIAEFSKTGIIYNNMGGQEFKGVDRPGAKTEFHTEFNIDEFVKNLKENYVENNNMFEASVMFLYRNKHSAVPIIDAMYKYRLPVIVAGTDKKGTVKITGHTPANKLPVIRDLCGLLELVKNPQSPSMLTILNRLIPELKEFKNTPAKSPLYKIMNKDGKSFLEIEYAFKDKKVGEELFTVMKMARKLYLDRRSVGDIFNAIFPFYRKIYLTIMERYLEQPSAFYINLVKPLLENKTYDAFIRDEIDKNDFVTDCFARRTGARCLTFHGSKGTEATIVHIIDAEEGIIPNKKMLEDTLNNNCVIDAARDIRNERSLVYVAKTRALRELHIHYKKELSSLFTSNNAYYGLDKAYESYVDNYQDVKVFAEFFGGV